MAVKQVTVPEIGVVSLYKRKGVRGVRLSITHNGEVRVTLPAWAPYRLGIEFVRSKADWIREKTVPKLPIRHGDRVGKAHRFVFTEALGRKTATSRIIGTDIRITADSALADDPSTQKTAHSAAIRALKKEAEQLLPQKLAALAALYGFSYRSVQIRQLKSRWGSCNEHTDITLNCFLMQLPWHLIDYVLLHELTHTRVMAHGRPFWNELGQYVNGLAEIRKEIKTYQPALLTTPAPVLGGTVDSPLEVPVNII